MESYSCELCRVTVNSCNIFVFSLDYFGLLQMKVDYFVNLGVSFFQNVRSCPRKVLEF